jgi:glycosyl transferase family 25
MDKIDKIIYINMDSRLDRRKEIEEQFKRVCIPSEKIIRFSGIRHPTSPNAGCNMSHAAALKLAYDLNLQNVLIFEDDFDFIEDIEFVNSSLSKFFYETSGIPWKAVLLAFGNQESGDFSENISYCLKAKNAAGYLVHRSHMLELSNTIQEAVEPMAATGMHWIYQNDIVWQKCMAKGNWFHFKKRLGFQRLGFSNLAGQVVDHTMDGV